ncbi:MAG TPA: c-type cytochrome [Acidimicrobiia bacterium]|nr:c-type cytochrome [Acidimicrobiia bacterium]
MTASVITVVAVVAGMAWLAVLGVSAVRNRGSEEVAPNLAPGLTDAEVETSRLEAGQKAAIAFSALLAVSLPLYFLGELDRQDAFVDEFAGESIARGEHIVEEFACFNCHGPEGAGGVARYVEQRSGVTVSWEAPSLNDILLRYDEDEVNYWITFGRGNTPMPPWGVPGGGPLNELQVVDVVNYLKTIQAPQAAALEELEPAITVQLDRLANADATVAAAILNQRQTIADIESAPEEFRAFAPLAERADELEERAGEGIDTDGDGISDSVETELSALTAEVAALFRVVEPIALDPEAPDADLADEAVTQLEAAIERDPILEQNLAEVVAAIEGGEVDPSTGLTAAALEVLGASLAEAENLGVVGLPSDIESAADAAELVEALTEASGAEGSDPAIGELLTEVSTAVEGSADPDGDGLSSAAEDAITAQMADAAERTIPTQVAVVNLDPANPASVGGANDAATLNTVVGNLDSLRVTLRVATENNESLLATEVGGLAFLEAALDQRAWEIDIEGVAEAMEVSTEMAQRAVGIFNANCARCHTAGFSAGTPYTQEAGSGGFGPALWDGRPLIQFGDVPSDPETEVDLLVQFLTEGSEANKPYGLNGFGSGRMPAFGAILSAEDIELLAAYLRAGNMDGSE